ncbi:TonB-dependent receptor [Paraglaciecola arctica]|uniref:TonB-dependent receptor n=1 Tax=Paraglaciecola arctica TaxID=1128911 RepID=UPI001C065935|nr:TonB-dependent receptor [Paraglaciecola arctica]MBU3002960.1 TonB-dependent receptor [Paraglaciecola arctica]
MINTKINKQKQLKNLSGCLIVSALTMGINQALAQEVADDHEYEVIQVSATKRTASIQDVPVSVAAVTAQKMEKIGISDVEDLSILIPNFEINSAAILPNLYVRGLGGGTSHSIEQSVGRFVDDVYISRAAINLHPFMDIQAVEVLRGPQGTLFGKNTAAGAMIMRTANPDSDFGYGINLSASSFSTTGGTKEVSGYVTGALSDTVDARLAFLYRDKDGYYINTMDGPDGADREDTGVRAKFLWQASENTQVGLKLEYMEYTELGSDTAEINAFGGPPLSVWQDISTASGADGSTITEPKLDWVVHYNCGPSLDTAGNDIGSFCPSRDQESTNVTLNIEHEFEAGILTLISAVQNYEYDHNFHGLDMGLANLFRANRHEKYDGVSQEVRYTSEESDSFDYIVGAYYEDSSLERGQTSHFNLPALGGPQQTEEEPWTQDTQTLALFGQARWKFTEDWTAILGGRWATEDKDFAFRRYLNEYQTDIPLHEEDEVNRVESRSESKFTPSVTLQWQASDDLNAYATVAQGHKTGGFSDRVESQDADMEFDAEEVQSIEVGIKSTWLDGALNLNLALFSMDIEGLQLATQLEGTVAQFSVDNAADSTSEGLELELFWYASDNWTLGGNFSITDASYDEFIGGADCDASLRNADGVCDLSGQPLIYAPENKGAVFAEYYGDDMIGEWDFNARTDIAFTGDQYTDITYVDAVMQESYTTLNASMRFVSPDEDMTISLIGKNLTDEKIMAWGVPSGPNILAAMAPPREIQLKFKYQY